jgi:hypothetical protein
MLPTRVVIPDITTALPFLGETKVSPVQSAVGCLVTLRRAHALLEETSTGGMYSFTGCNQRERERMSKPCCGKLVRAFAIDQAQQRVRGTARRSVESTACSRKDAHIAY